MVNPPPNVRVRQTPAFYCIKTVGRTPLWINLFLLAWFVPWTAFTIHLYASSFGYVEPMNVEGSLLGTALGFTFFWVMALFIILFLNFRVMETRLGTNHLEHRCGLAGLVLRRELTRAAVVSVSVVKQDAYVDAAGDAKEARWELCVDGTVDSALLALGLIKLRSWPSEHTRFTVDSAETLEGLRWYAMALSNWSGKTLRIENLAKQIVPDEAK